jgi:hypothetical protein
VGGGAADGVRLDGNGRWERGKRAGSGSYDEKQDMYRAVGVVLQDASLVVPGESPLFSRAQHPQPEALLNAQQSITDV